MAKIGIFYGSTEGNTERVVNQVLEFFGDGVCLAIPRRIARNTASARNMKIAYAIRPAVINGPSIGWARPSASGFGRGGGM